MHPESHACHAKRMSHHVISRVHAARPDANPHDTAPRHARGMPQTRPIPAACHAKATKVCTAPHADARSARRAIESVAPSRISAQGISSLPPRRPNREKDSGERFWSIKTMYQDHASRLCMWTMCQDYVSRLCI